MGSNSGGSLTRPIFVLGLGIIFGAVISFLTKRKRNQLENQTQTEQSETINQDKKSTNHTEEEPVGCCGGGSCGDQEQSCKYSQKPLDGMNLQFTKMHFKKYN